MSTLAPARPFLITVEQAARIYPFPIWECDPLRSTCCLVAVHNGEGCYRHRWPLACQVVTHLDPDYFSVERVADREEARRAEWRYAWDW